METKNSAEEKEVVYGLFMDDVHCIILAEYYDTREEAEYNFEGYRLGLVEDRPGRGEFGERKGQKCYTQKSVYGTFNLYIVEMPKDKAGCILTI